MGNGRRNSGENDVCDFAGSLFGECEQKCLVVN